MELGKISSITGANVTPWCAGEPNNGGQREDVAALKAKNDGYCFFDVFSGIAVRKFICKQSKLKLVWLPTAIIMILHITLWLIL